LFGSKAILQEAVIHLEHLNCFFHPQSKLQIFGFKQQGLK